MSREETNLHRAVAQVLEWTYGLTNLEFEIGGVQFNKINDGQDDSYGVMAETVTARIVGIKHPFALVVETIRMNLTAQARMTDDVLGDRKEMKVIEGDTQDLHSFMLRQDQGGFGVISVQVIMGTFDGGDKALSTTFTFRNNMLHRVHQR